MLGLRRSRWRTVTGGSRVYQSPGCGVHTDRPSLTYSLNRLQKLGTTVGYCVTLNRTDEIDESAVCEAGFAIRSLRDMQIVPTHPANDSLPEFPAVRPTF